MDRDDEQGEVVERQRERARRLADDTGMIGSEAQEPGPGRDTALTDPDPVASSVDQPRTTVAMSEGDPARTRLGAHEAGAEPIGATAPELVADASPPRERDEDEPLPGERDEEEPPPLV
jgi:hypothetical protein